MGKRLRDEELKDIISKIIRRKGHISSLNELKNEIEEVIGENYSVSNKRLVKLLKSIDFVKMKIKVREDRKGEEVDICPVCGRKLRKLYVKTLDGQKKFVGLKCDYCGFESKTKSFKPSRYEIYLS